jgi:hypothetical protein
MADSLHVVSNRTYYQPTELNAGPGRHDGDSQNLEVTDDDAKTIAGNCHPECKQTVLTPTNVKMLVRAHDILGGFDEGEVEVSVTQSGGTETVNPQAVRNKLKDLLEKAKTSSLTKDEYGELYKNVTDAYRIIADARDSADSPSDLDESKERLAAASFWLAQLRFNMAQQLDTSDKDGACQDLKSADDRLNGMKLQERFGNKSISIDEISRNKANQYENTCFMFKEIDARTGKIVYWPATHTEGRNFTPIFDHPLTHAQMVDYMEHQSKILILIKEVLNNLKAAIKDSFPSLHSDGADDDSETGELSLVGDQETSDSEFHEIITAEFL